MRNISWLLALAAIIAVACNRSDRPREAPAPRPVVIRSSPDASAPPLERDLWAEPEYQALMERLQRVIDQPITEPTGFPPFRIFEGVNGLTQVPTGSPCRWVEVERSRGDHVVRFLPDSFLEDGRFRRYVRSDFGRCGFPAETGWSNVLKEALIQFARAPWAHENLFGHGAFASGSGDGHIRVMAVYGILQTDLINEGGTETWYDFRTNVIPRIYASERLLDQAFVWAMPHLNRVWQVLPTADQTNYRLILRHAREYAANFDEAAEVAYLHRLEQGTCEHPLRDASSMTWFQLHVRAGYPASACTYQFAHSGPDGHETPYRKVEAWVFRRIHDGMPRERLLRYLDRVLAALPPV
jgi:hypothetical protein